MRRAKDEVNYARELFVVTGVGKTGRPIRRVYPTRGEAERDATAAKKHGSKNVEIKSSIEEKKITVRSVVDKSSGDIGLVVRHKKKVKL